MSTDDRIAALDDRHTELLRRHPDFDGRTAAHNSANAAISLLIDAACLAEGEPGRVVLSECFTYFAREDLRAAGTEPSESQILLATLQLAVARLGEALGVQPTGGCNANP